MDLVARNVSDLLGRLRQALTIVLVGLIAGGSVVALGLKAVVLVPGIAFALAMMLIPYSPLFAIVASTPINVVIAGPITVIRLAIVFGVLVAILQRIKGQTPRMASIWPDGGLTLILFIWIFFATIVISEGELVARLGGFFIYAVIFFFLIIYVESVERVRQVMITMIIVGFVQAGLAVGEAVFDFVPLGGLQADLAEMRGEEVRIVGASAHPIFLAGFFQMVMTFALVMAWQAKSAFWRAFFLAAMALFVIGWIAAWARSSWVGMAMMLGVGMVLWSRPTRILAVIGGSAAFVILALHDFSMTAVIDTIDNLAAVQRGSYRAGVSHSTESFSWRTENWMGAFNIWLGSPIFGVGVDRVDQFMLANLPPHAVEHRFVPPAIPHNMFLQMLAEAGLPAFLMFTALWISAFVGAFRAWQVPHLRPYAFAFLVVMSGQATTYFFNPIPREIWFSMAMALVLGRLARAHAEAGARPSAPPAAMLGQAAAGR